MRTSGVITNSMGYPYQWVRQADYAPRDGYSLNYGTFGNPITMRVVNNREVIEATQLLGATFQRGMQISSITYPYDFSNYTVYRRRAGQRAPYGL